MRHPLLARAVLLAIACLLLAGAAGPGQTADSRPADVGQLRDITGIEKEPPEPTRTWRPLWLAPAVVGLGGAALLCWRYCRRRQPAPEAPPDRRALAELEHLDALGLPATGQVERYHTLLSDIVRRYLELRFQLHAPQQSTDEFLEAMRRSPRLTAEQEGLLRDFLRQCDLAKFARAGFSAEECQAAARVARTFVEQTPAQEKPAEALKPG